MTFPSLSLSFRHIAVCLTTLLTVISLPALYVEAGSSSTSTLSSPAPELPRSKSRRWSSPNYYPPWNSSPLIQHDGFLKDQFQRIPGDWEEEVRLRTRQSLETKCRVRQVPGDGNCLFHSISLCLQHANNGTHWDFSRCTEQLYEHSQALRKQAVSCLRQPHKRLFLQGSESLKSSELVHAAAQQYGLTSEEYCNAMEQDSVWGGGPEIVALCNILRRPIHVYELTTQTAKDGRDTFVLRRMACFGSPRFDRREALHILSADSRFPDLEPGEQLESGNHFLSLFPLKRKRLRGGSFKDGDSIDDEDDEARAETTYKEGSADRKWSIWRWWGQLLR